MLPGTAEMHIMAYWQVRPDKSFVTFMLFYIWLYLIWPKDVRFVFRRCRFNKIIIIILSISWFTLEKTRYNVLGLWKFGVTVIIQIYTTSLRELAMCHMGGELLAQPRHPLSPSSFHFSHRTSLSGNWMGNMLLWNRSLNRFRAFSQSVVDRHILTMERPWMHFWRYTEITPD